MNLNFIFQKIQKLNIMKKIFDVKRIKKNIKL